MTQAQQPEALRLAAWLQEGAWYKMKLGDVEAAGRELRRQHARIEELESQLAALASTAARNHDELVEKFMAPWILGAHPHDANDVRRSAKALIKAALDAPPSSTYIGANVAERLESMADDQLPGSQAQGDLYAAATAWRKHIAPKAAPAAVAGPSDAAAWAQGARFALEAVTKIDSICWLTDSMREIGIKQAANAVIAERDRLLAAAAPQPPAAAPAPIDMVLHCPKCGMQHVDAPEDAECDGEVVHSFGWSNPPHRSHLCHGCGHIWRPADVPTNGVHAVATKGKADSPIAAPQQAAPAHGETDYQRGFRHGYNRRDAEVKGALA